MKRLLHVIDTTGAGGAETVFVELAARTREAGYESIAIVRGDGWVKRALQRAGVQFYIMDTRGSFNVRYLRQLIRVLRYERIDLIQSHLLGSNLYSGMAGLITKKPVVASFHGAVDFSASEKFRSAKVALMNAGVSTYIAVSNSLKVSLERYGVRSPRVIYNGIDVAKYTVARRQNIRSLLGLRDSDVLVGALGNIRPAKAYDVLIMAAKSVCERHANVHFAIAGDDSKTSALKLKALTHEYGLQDKVHFVGFQADTASYLAELDIFALSSSSEGFSIATIEAQAVGLPVIATRSGGPEEIVEHDSNGLLVDVNDADQLAAEIGLLATRPALRERLGMAGRRTAAERFSIDRMLQGYTQVYEELLPQVCGL